MKKLKSIGQEHRERMIEMQEDFNPTPSSVHEYKTRKQIGSNKQQPKKRRK